MLTVERARALFRYDPNTGVLYRRLKTKEKVGTAKTPNGYLVVCVGGKQYQTHRLAWLIHYGEWPKQEIDHINRVKTDNRIANLRDVSRAENMANTDCNMGGWTVPAGGGTDLRAFLEKQYVESDRGGSNAQPPA